MPVGNEYIVVTEFPWQNHSGKTTNPRLFASSRIKQYSFPTFVTSALSTAASVMVLMGSTRIQL